MTFNEGNLRDGLATFTKSSTRTSMKAVKQFKALVAAGTSQKTAIDTVLTEAVKGFANEDAKLAAAKTAAGITPKARLVAAATTARMHVPTITPPTKPIKHIKVTDSTTPEPPKKSLRDRLGDVGDMIGASVESTGKLIFVTILSGLILGAFFRIIFSDLFNLAFNAPFGWVIFWVMCAVCSFLAFTILLRLRQRAKARQAHYEAHQKEVHSPALSA